MQTGIFIGVLARGENGRVDSYGMERWTTAATVYAARGDLPLLDD